MLVTPNGKPAGNMDRTMLLSLWTKQLALEGKKIIYVAGIGRPTFPLSYKTAISGASYWAVLAVRAFFAGIRLKISKIFFINLEKNTSSFVSAIDYGHPQGELVARKKMANALNTWYGQSLKITEDNILFTVGGAAALHITFNVINRKNPGGRILTSFPHYSLYTGSYGQNNLFEIPVMQSAGYKLNAQLLEMTIEKAYELAQNDGQFPSAFLLCDPSNPLATALDENELRAIAEVLRIYPGLFIILDEAYAEMRLDGKRLSLLSIAPDLKNRTILIRSATKALSAAGERMAAAVVFDEELMNQLTAEHVNICGHAPKSLQILFSSAMGNLTPKKQKELMMYYSPKLAFVSQKIKDLKIQMPDKDYHAIATFYAMADLSEFIGTPINKACFRAIKREKANEEFSYIETDEEIVYHLLFSYGIMIAPLSYFGLDKKLGYVRITCSAAQQELEEIMSRLEIALQTARNFKNEFMMQASFTRQESCSTPYVDEEAFGVTLS